MKPAGYLIAISHSATNNILPVDLLQAAEEILPVFGTSTDETVRNLYVVPSDDITAMELTARLQALPCIGSVSVIALSNTFKRGELKNVRTLLKDFGINAGTVPDAELATYLASTLAREYTYYMEKGFRQNQNGLSPLRIRRVEDLRRQIAQQGNETGCVVNGTTEMYKGTEIKVVTATFEISEPEEPPPPPPPAALSEMSDKQIRQWVKAYKKGRLKAKDIQVIRTSAEVVINWKLDDTKEELRHKIQ